MFHLLLLYFPLSFKIKITKKVKVGDGKLFNMKMDTYRVKFDVVHCSCVVRNDLLFLP